MDNKRLLLQLEQVRRQINRDIINPEIKTLEVKDLQPIVEMVACARAAYVGELFSVAAAAGCGRPPEDIGRLRQLRETFEELVAAMNALETMIERGYVDVQGNLD
jgi:hypothetical protein